MGGDKSVMRSLVTEAWENSRTLLLPLCGAEKRAFCDNYFV